MSARAHSLATSDRSPYRNGIDKAPGNDCLYCWTERSRSLVHSAKGSGHAELAEHNHCSPRVELDLREEVTIEMSICVRLIRRISVNTPL